MQTGRLIGLLVRFAKSDQIWIVLGYQIHHCRKHLKTQSKATQEQRLENKPVFYPN